ncbi:hypothetical protein [uncultured Duncaniella sp.]|uniref:hypothetical protein n=1 Tax=uncultured Duncaniella sp. TaxID=2768039 RepID=UPI0027295249|nr:hypothetical protein [uncultured Duncaniella sp.]
MCKTAAPGTLICGIRVICEKKTIPFQRAPPNGAAIYGGSTCGFAECSHEQPHTRKHYFILSLTDYADFTDFSTRKAADAGSLIREIRVIREKKTSPISASTHNGAAIYGGSTCGCAECSRAQPSEN